MSLSLKNLSISSNETAAESPDSSVNVCGLSTKTFAGLGKELKAAPRVFIVYLLSDIVSRQVCKCLAHGVREELLKPISDKPNSYSKIMVIGSK